MKNYTVEEKTKLLRKQLAARTVAMRQVARRLRDLGSKATPQIEDECDQLASQLELALGKPEIL